ncbi:PRC and DUF2382 domain-containing protein [Streptomyces sp. NPDC049954]|uniref:PRC and DUF2382 domain-containing protein n=1 Tax=Streptomyces sp. NPDC049954 TaxID=3155779 RepID=UPI003418F2D2
MTSDEGFLSVDQLVGLTAYDQDGSKVGSVEQVYRDDASGRPEWVTVKTGLFGMKETFVPLDGARSDAQGLHLAHDKNTIKDAPHMDADQHLDADGERELYAHYGKTRTSADEGTGMGQPSAGEESAAAAGGAAAPGGMADARPVDAEITDDDRPADARITDSGYGGDHRDELIRSEERLHVGTQEEESGRARLHKVVVTENVTTTVPVSHEEARLVREPIREGDTVRPDFGDAVAEVTLHAERPVVRKEAVAVERVRLESEKVTEQEEVSETVRKEQVEYDDGMGDVEGGRGRKGPSH